MNCALIKRAYIATCLILYYFETVAEPGTFTVKMRKVNHVMIAMIPIGSTAHNVSRLECAFACRATRYCYSFYYQVHTKLCTLGSWVIIGTSARDSESQLYTQGSFCNNKQHFIYHYYTNVPMCLFISKQKLDYQGSKTACQGLNATLCSVKSFRKTYAIQGYFEEAYPNVTQFNMLLWVGLNNLQATNEYRWEDDGTQLDMSSSLKRAVFHYNQPDNPLTERCMAFDYPSNDLHDQNCSIPLVFCCEKQPFNNYP